MSAGRQSEHALQNYAMIVTMIVTSDPLVTLLRGFHDHRYEGRGHEGGLVTDRDPSCLFVTNRTASYSDRDPIS